MKTLVIGASTTSSRFSYKAIKSLLRHNIDVIAIGKTPGEINGVTIHTTPQNLQGVHTVLLYLSAENQKQYYDYILGLSPKRIVFNPGAENPEFESMAKKNDINVVNECGLVMINTNKY